MVYIVCFVSQASLVKPLFEKKGAKELLENPCMSKFHPKFIMKDKPVICKELNIQYIQELQRYCKK